jgi:hypothetical protein
MSETAISELEVAILMDDHEATRGRSIWSLVTALFRFPLYVLTDGLSKLEPRATVVVRRRDTRKTLLTHQWGRDVQQAEIDALFIREILHRVSYSEFLDEYGLHEDPAQASGDP